MQTVNFSRHGRFKSSMTMKSFKLPCAPPKTGSTVSLKRDRHTARYRYLCNCYVKERSEESSPSCSPASGKEKSLISKPPARWPAALPANAEGANLA